MSQLDPIPYSDAQLRAILERVRTIAMVDVFRPSKDAPGIVKDAIAIGAPVVWMQLGIRNDEAAALGEAAGIEIIMNRCPKIEFGRLAGELSWSGVNSSIIQNRAPQAPRPRSIKGGRAKERPSSSHNLSYGFETRAIPALLYVDAAGRRVRRLAQPLWRLADAVRTLIQEARLDLPFRRSDRPREFSPRVDAAMQSDLRREPRQSRRHHRRHRE